MAKKIDGYIKLQIPAGQANPSPPVGPALGQKGVTGNSDNFRYACRTLDSLSQANGRDKDMRGIVCPLIITLHIYDEGAMWSPEPFAKQRTPETVRKRAARRSCWRSGTCRNHVHALVICSTRIAAFSKRSST